MAGLGETCSHVASLLWVIAVGVERRQSLTVTQKSVYWVMPPGAQKAPYGQIHDIEFVGKKRKSHSFKSATTCQDGGERKIIASTPSEEEKKSFLIH